MRPLHLFLAGTCATIGLFLLLTARISSQAHDSVIRRVQHGESATNLAPPNVLHALSIGAVIFGALLILAAVYFLAVTTRNRLAVMFMFGGCLVIVALAWLLYHG